MGEVEFKTPPTPQGKSNAGYRNIFMVPPSPWGKSLVGVGEFGGVYSMYYLWEIAAVDDSILRDN